MNKSDARITKTTHTKPKETEDVTTTNSVKSYPTPHPCDDGDTPSVPDKPTPNPNRPKPSQKENLIYTNGVQKKGNVVSVKVDPDSTGYMRTSEDGLSIKYLINKLECVRKSLKKINDNLNQLKDDVQPAVIIEHIIENSKEFQTDEDGMIELKLGDGLGKDGKGYIGVTLDEDTLGFDENGKIMTIWGQFTQE